MFSGPRNGSRGHSTFSLHSRRLLTGTPLEGQETSQTPMEVSKASQPGKWTAPEGHLLGVV